METSDFIHEIGPEGCIYIENFKGFGEPGQYIPLARLTLLFGPNSSGKSTVFDALEFLRDMVYRPSTNNYEFLDCSSLVHKGQREKDIVIGLLHFAPGSNMPHPAHCYPYPCFRFTVGAFDGLTALSSVEARLGTEPVFVMDVVDQNVLRFREFLGGSGLVQQLFGVNPKPTDSRNSTPAIISRTNECLRSLPLEFRIAEGRSNLKDDQLSALPPAISEMLSDLFTRFAERLGQPYWLFDNNFVQIPALRRVLTRKEQLTLDLGASRGTRDSELLVWESLIRNCHVHAAPGQRTFLERINRWLGPEGIGLDYSLVLRQETLPFGGSGRPYFVATSNSAGKVDLDLTHVGTGVSQVIPVVGACCLHSDMWVLIEQPELHLHPRAQCSLADVFVAKLRPLEKEFNLHNVFLLETHSEHLLLRLLKRVRQTSKGTLQDQAYSLSPDELSVVYIRQTPEGSIVSRMPVTSDGDFNEPWPEGFFEERTEELS